MIEQVYRFAVRPYIIWCVDVGGCSCCGCRCAACSRVSPQDVAARMPAATANVRAFVDFSLGNVDHLFMMSDEDLACWATSKIHVLGSGRNRARLERKCY